jgi:ATP-dependent DNA helicase DinG
MLDSFDKFFDNHGPIADVLPGYAPRKQQLDSSAAVNECFRHTGSISLIEAGTGVGKTLAYLVPTILKARNDNKVVISTHTLALQAQLWEKDIPLALSLQPKKLRAALLKGRGNYLCLQEMNAARSDIWTAGDQQFEEILDWSGDTETGDLAELPFSFPGWSEISAHPDTCRGAECRYFDDCFFYKAKRYAEDASILLVNHALYFSDLALRRVDSDSSLLPVHTRVVFDEAHHLEQAASQAFGVTVNSGRVASLVKKLHRISTKLELDEDKLRMLEREASELFSFFRDCGKQEFTVQDIMPDLSWAQNKTYLIGVILQEIATTMGRIDTADDRILHERLEGLTRQTVRLRDELLALFNSVDDNYIRWGSVTTLRDRSAFVSLQWTPISVAPILYDALWQPKEQSAALISATLANDGGFGYLKNRLGLTGTIISGKADEEDSQVQIVDTPCIEMIADSPFDYAANCRLYIPESLPMPNDSLDYTTEIVSEIKDLVFASNGGAFLLFTSHRMLRHAYSMILDAQMPYPLFSQGEMPSGRLIDEFRNSRNGVLFGTQSFWEGVDVPGDSLRLVVVDRLPFGSPENPMTKAREAAITKAGGDWFNDFALPQAQLKLKQGFGRLIRNSTDRGVVAVLDRRLVTKRYGIKFLNYLPKATRVSTIEEVRQFYLAGEPSASKPR